MNTKEFKKLLNEAVETIHEETAKRIIAEEQNSKLLAVLFRIHSETENIGFDLAHGGNGA